MDADQFSVRPSVSIENILERKVRRIGNARWLNPEQLIVSTTEPDSGKLVIRSLSMDGVLGAPIGEGSLASASPDGRMLIRHTDDTWVVSEVGDGESVRIDEPADECGCFSSGSTPVWSPNGRFVAVIEGHRPAEAAMTPEAATMNGVPVIDMANHVPALARWSSRITIVDRADPSTAQRIVLSESALGIGWSSDNVLFVTKSNLGLGDPTTAIVRIRPGTQDIEEIYRTAGRFQGMVPAIHPAGDMMAVVLDVDNRIWDDFASIILIDSDTGEELRRLTYNLPIRGGDYVWSSKGDELYARVGGGGIEQIYAFPLHGESRALTRGQRMHWDMNLSPDGRRLSYRTSDGYGRKDLRVVDLATGDEHIVLVLDEPAEEFMLGEWRHVRWDSTDGVRPFGHLILPPYFDQSRRYPMIVDVHGGGEGSRLGFGAPLTSRVAFGPLEWHAWAALGYIVFVPDYRSSGDYGPEVIATRYKSGEFGAIKDIDDIISGTRFVIEQGFVDPARVAILGNSAGGQRVYILLTQHDLYAAAILNESISPDPVSTFIKLASGEHTGGYPAGIFRQLYGGKLADFPDRYKTNYMFDSYRIRTPTLIMLGNEKRGGIFHMPNEVLYSILKQHNIPTRLIKFVEEGHAYSRPESAKLAFNEVRRWLETHMPAGSMASTSTAAN